MAPNIHLKMLIIRRNERELTVAAVQTSFTCKCRSSSVLSLVVTCTKSETAANPFYPPGNQAGPDKPNRMSGILATIISRKLQSRLGLPAPAKKGHRNFHRGTTLCHQYVLDGLCQTPKTVFFSKNDQLRRDRV